MLDDSYFFNQQSVGGGVSSRGTDCELPLKTRRRRYVVESDSDDDVDVDVDIGIDLSKKKALDNALATGIRLSERIKNIEEIIDDNKKARQATGSKDNVNESAQGDSKMKGMTVISVCSEDGYHSDNASCAQVLPMLDLKLCMGNS